LFLGGNSSQFLQHEITKLCATMKDFYKTLAAALGLNKRLIGPEQITLQKELEMGFEEFKKQIMQYITLSEEEKNVEFN